jgi:aldehyde dehydrogenase (NAD+)
VISAGPSARAASISPAAVDAGGRVVAAASGPMDLDKGYYWEPTMLDLPDNGNPAAQEEIFGPVVAVIGYRTSTMPLPWPTIRSSACPPGSTGQDKVASAQHGLKIRSGAVNVNGAVMSSYASGGGIKMSGLGRERGVEGLREFQMMTTFNIGG